MYAYSTNFCRAYQFILSNCSVLFTISIDFWLIMLVLIIFAVFLCKCWGVMKEKAYKYIYNALSVHSSVLWLFVVLFQYQRNLLFPKKLQNYSMFQRLQNWIYKHLYCLNFDFLLFLFNLLFYLIGLQTVFNIIFLILYLCDL